MSDVLQCGGQFLILKTCAISSMTDMTISLDICVDEKAVCKYLSLEPNSILHMASSIYYTVLTSIAFSKKKCYNWENRGKSVLFYFLRSFTGNCSLRDVTEGLKPRILEPGFEF